MRDDLVEKIASIPGITVTNHRGKPERYWIEVQVADKDALSALCQVSAYANCPLHLYEWAKYDFRYTLEINERSRKIIMETVDE